MTRKQFTELMKELVSLRKDEDDLNTAFKKLEPDFNYISFGRYETLVVRSLEFAMNDKYQWISYWLYDCECGKKEMKVIDKDGKKVPMKTINDLYNCIINNK